VRADGTPDTLNALRELGSSPATSDVLRETFLSLLAEVGDAKDLAGLLEVKTFTSASGYDAPRQARVLQVLARAARARNVQPADDPSALLRALWKNTTNGPLRVAVLQLATEWKLRTFDTAALFAAACTPDDDELRIAGAVALAALAGDDARKLLESLTNPSRIRGERVAAAIGLLSLDLPRAASVAAGVLSADEKGESIARLLPPFLQRAGGAAALATALAANSPTRRAAESGLSLMSASGRRDEKLADIFSEAAGFKRQLRQMTAGETAAFTFEVRIKGDAKRGAELFRRPEMGCITCHAVNGQGGNIGPNLSALGTAQPVDFIIGAILEPNKEVKEGFSSIEVTTKEGEVFQGYKVRSDGKELVLRDVLQNREVRIRTDTIQEQTDRGSVMPSGLVEHLGREEFRDLIRFLSELGKPN
jgi:putative heme-binding domain-containing protein